MAFLRSLLAVAVLTLLEFYVTVYKVPQLIGAPATIALLAATSLLGIWLLRLQGRTAWRRFTAALAERRPPHQEVLDGVLVIFGGAFLILPGFVTDVIGLVLLLPPTRPLVRRRLARRLERRSFAGVAGAVRRRSRVDGRDFDVDGTAAEPGPYETAPARPGGGRLEP